jgi:hypothetical protein
MYLFIVHAFKNVYNILSYSTRKQTSDKQEVVIENVGETLTNQGPIRNKDEIM